MGDVPPQVLADLSAGLVETANLMEWLATDMSHLAQVVAAGPVPIGLRMSLSEAAEGMRGRGVTDRLRLVGAAIARGSPEMAGSTFKRLASHRSDVVRQWVCYAVNDPSLFKSLEDRLDHTLQFASAGRVKGSFRNITCKKANSMVSYIDLATISASCGIIATATRKTALSREPNASPNVSLTIPGVTATVTTLA
jgi:hypothetical protein